MQVLQLQHNHNSLNLSSMSVLLGKTAMARSRALYVMIEIILV